MEKVKGGTSNQREIRAMPKISNWIRLSPVSVLPYVGTEIALTQTSKVTTRTHTKRKLFSFTFLVSSSFFLILILLLLVSIYCF